MTTEQRLRLALEMSESLRNVALAVLRSRRPDLDANSLSRRTGPHHVWVGAPAVTLEDLLRRLVPILERVRVPYMLTGSVASSAHGMPRSTRDLDIVIAPTRGQLQALMREFPAPTITPTTTGTSSPDTTKPVQYRRPRHRMEKSNF